MTIENNRNVSSQEISRSFRGILRISPDDAGGDTGLTENLTYVYDSIGTKSGFAVSTSGTLIDDCTTSKLKVTSSLTFNNSTNVPIAAPASNEILIGDGTGNYIKSNLKDFINLVIEENRINQQLVPVGTIFSVALGAHDLNLLPAAFRGYYDFCEGQGSNSQSGLTYNAANFPDLCKVIKGTVSGNFTIPDLRNRFIRNACIAAGGYNGNWVAGEGGYMIPVHGPFNYEDPQTNVSQAGTRDHVHYQLRNYNNQQYRGGLPSGLQGIQGSGGMNTNTRLTGFYGWGNGDGIACTPFGKSFIGNIDEETPNCVPTGRMQPLNNDPTGTPQETRPLTIALYHIIKIK